jgi:hypothetical protein
MTPTEWGDLAPTDRRFLEQAALERNRREAERQEEIG